jgi:SagB-type dehydrogenase family enzyme
MDARVEPADDDSIQSEMRAREKRRGRGLAPPALSARLSPRVTLEVHAGGRIVAGFDGNFLGMGAFSAAAAERARDLRSGLPLASFASSRSIDRETDLLVRRLAAHRLLEYRLGRSLDDAQVVIEPQVADYWPQTPRLRDADVLVLSRFAYLRRRGDAMVLESPRAGALFRLCNPDIAAALAALAAPRPIRELTRRGGFSGVEILALLVDAHILLKAERSAASRNRPAEGDDDLLLWEFHDLLFHARSTQGRHANPLGGTYPHAGVIPPLPAVRRRWRGKAIDLRKLTAADSREPSPVAKLLRKRHSTRGFDDARPITLAELARFLDGAARVVSRWTSRADLGDTSPLVAYAARPYPSAGASYPLELYLAVDRCDGLARGFYHYDAGAHALAPIAARAPDLQALLTAAAFAMDAPAAPQILITIAARFGRASWKYSAFAYALVLKDVGVLTQTLYLMATDMGLGGCAIGSADIDLFARMTGIEFHVEGPVGQFALGRGSG